MIISKEKSKQMLEAAKPLIKWMNENLHPHTECRVDHISVELVEGIAAEKTEEFIKD